MKKFGILVLVTLFLGLTAYQSDHKKEKRLKQQSEVAHLIEMGQFRFVARTANSELGTINDLSPTYDLVFDSLRVKAYLPFYGRAYSAPYGGPGGVKFDLKAKKIDRSWSEKKKLYTISTKLFDSQDSYSIVLTAGLNGFADLKISFQNRSWISYYGTIEKIEPK